MDIRDSWGEGGTPIDNMFASLLGKGDSGQGEGTSRADEAILVFLSGWEEISRLRERLLTSPVFGDDARFLILPLHSMLHSMEQRKVFGRPPAGVRKIVLATNIAETALTIDDVVFVIDCGRLREKSYDPYTNVATLQVSFRMKAPSELKPVASCFRQDSETLRCNICTTSIAPTSYPRSNPQSNLPATPLPRPSFVPGSRSCRPCKLQAHRLLSFVDRHGCFSLCY